MSNHYVTTLDASRPQLTDPVAEGAEEIRIVKESIKNTFPYANSALTVSNAAIVAAVEGLDIINNEISALKARIEALENA